MNLVEEVRSWLIQERVGLLLKADLIRLVDEKIAQLKNPPDFLITISLGEPIAHVPNLDFIKDRVAGKDCALIAKKMLNMLKAGEITFEDIGLFSLRLCQLLENQETPYLDFDWINDEVYLMNEGVKEKEQSKKDIVEVLEKLSAL